MYQNDNIEFLINGQYSSPLWLTQGVKQGKHQIMDPLREGKGKKVYEGVFTLSIVFKKCSVLESGNNLEWFRSKMKRIVSIQKSAKL